MNPKPSHYVISDLHLGHKAILGYCRPWFESIKQHDEHIVNNICELSKDDFLWILGDVAFKRSALMKLKEASCRKGLIGGNHDTLALDAYREVFDEMRGVAQMKAQIEVPARIQGLSALPPIKKEAHILFSHIPMHPDQMRWTHNIHGHLHTYHVDDPRYINVSCEVVGFKPVTIQSLLEDK